MKIHTCAYSNDKVFGYVSWNGTSWVYQIIDTIIAMFGVEHLVLDAYDNPHVSYFVTSSSRYGNLTYATYAEPLRPPVSSFPDFPLFIVVPVLVVLIILTALLYWRKHSRLKRAQLNKIEPVISA